jgi:hypothetical protein
MSGLKDMGVSFEINMKRRFLDRVYADELHPVFRKYFMRAGAETRLAARGKLRKAPMLKMSELTKYQRIAYEAWKARYKAGETTIRPRRPDRSAKYGNPPYIHPKPRSLLKDRVFFALSHDKQYVVVGPELVGRNKRLYRQGDLSSLEDLEKGWPFMRPAFRDIMPKLPSYLEQYRKR